MPHKGKGQGGRDETKIKTRPDPEGHATQMAEVFAELFEGLRSEAEFDMIGEGFLFALTIDRRYGGDLTSLIRAKDLGIHAKVAEKLEGGLVWLVLWIPRHSFAGFLALWGEFGDTRTKENKALDAALLSVEDVQLVALRALYFGPAAYYPSDDDELTWWEVWIPRDKLGHLGALKRFDGVLLPPHELNFTGDSVRLVKASPRQIVEAKLIRYLSSLRKPQFSVGLLLRLPASDAREFQEGALGRINIGADRVPVVLIDSGVNRNHPLFEQSSLIRDTVAIEFDPTSDTEQHGTGTASLIAFGEDLAGFIDGERSSIEVGVIIDSVNPLQVSSNPKPNLFGELTLKACKLLPNRDAKLFVSTISTDDPVALGKGVADSYSATLDLLAYGLDATTYFPNRETGFGKVLILQSAGNWNGRPVGAEINDATRRVQSPAQSWNALVIGAYTKLPRGDAGTLSLSVQPGDVSAYSTYGIGFETKQPLVPDVVFEGGNTVRERDGHNQHDDLSLLAANSRFSRQHPFMAMFGTSAAAALAGHFCACLRQRYPDYWPETIRALTINSARWTSQMLDRTLGTSTKRAMRKLVQQCGFGVPDFDIAANSTADRVTLVREAELQPFKMDKGDIKFDEIHLIELPWPELELQRLSLVASEESVELRVTLSYFVEPNPSRVDLLTRYRYESCGLRWRMQRPGETVAQLRAAVSAGTGEDTLEDPLDQWQIGRNNRHRGSVHTDIWLGSGAELSAMKHIAVYPVNGWWRSRKTANRYGQKMRYSLVISLTAPAVGVDLYEEVATLLRVEVDATVDT